MKPHIYFKTGGVFLGLMLLAPGASRASSHMDAPLITLDPAANTTDVYAMVAKGDGADTNKYLVVGLGVYPFEEPGIGPNKYNFDDQVLYQIHICTTNKTRAEKTTDAAAGRATLSYEFQFTTRYKDTKTILQSYLGVITNIGDASQNLTQTYTVKKLDHRTARTTVLFTGNIVPPNNEGIATPLYNQGDDGNNPAKPGVTESAGLDPYTAQAIYTNHEGYTVFAGQRDDGFFADVLAIFDLAQIRKPGLDSQKGFNIHEIVLRIPISELGSDLQSVGVYATTSRQAVTALRSGLAYTSAILKRSDPFIPGFGETANTFSGAWVQVGRQGNPLFNEALVALVDKDLYSRTAPSQDADLFAKYALTPELAAIMNALVFKSQVAPETNRTDLEGIFIPDVIKVDLSTPPARLTGGGDDDVGFSNLSVFGGDTLPSQLTGGAVAGGWPNGRRWGDNVVDIALTAVASDLRVSPPIVVPNVSGNVTSNDVVYNKVFPYESTPQNGRNHSHD